MKKYRVIFFGTPEFSVPFLEALINDANFEVVGVVTGEDKKAGRGQQLKKTAVAEYLSKLQINSNNSNGTNNNTINSHCERLEGARQSNKDCFVGLPPRNDIQVFKFNKLTIDSCKLIADLKPDVAVLVAYGKIIPQEIIDLFPAGIINVHPSLLPAYRGPDPLRQAVLDGINTTGVTIMKLDSQMDHGPIINQKKINLAPSDNLGDLYQKVITLAPSFLIKTLRLYLEEKLSPREQNHTLATYTHLIKKSDAQIDWNKSVSKIDRHIRAFNPIPGAYTILDDKIIKICHSAVKNDKIVIESVKPAGKKEITWSEFLNGYRGSIPQIMKSKIL